MRRLARALNCFVCNVLYSRRKIILWGGIQKTLDKNWHPMENDSRASSCLPRYVTFLPLRIAGIVCEEIRWRKKKVQLQTWNLIVK
jgi:hypothetical protein